MRGPLARAPAVALTLLLALLAVACAGRGERERTGREVHGEGAYDAVEPGVVAPAVPAILGCSAAGDCVLEQFDRPVSSVADCYCLQCPKPLNRALAAEHQAHWERWCEGSWEVANRCLAPMCPPPPGVLACVGGECGYSVH